MTDKSNTPLDKSEVLKVSAQVRNAITGERGTTMTAGNAWWRLIADALEAFATQSESAFIEVGQMFEIPDGFDGHPNTVFCEWNEMRSKLPAGTKIYVRR